MPIPFIKMNGAGNDFVIIDARTNPIRLKPEQVRKMAARNNPETRGCDQVIVMEPCEDADVFMRIYNADGGEVNACGNATRCVGWLVTQEKNVGNATVRTNADSLHCSLNLWGAGLPGWKDASALVTADMGMPRFGWQDIPLSQPLDTAHIPIETEGLSDPFCLSMGNPHLVFFAHDIGQIQHIEKVGTQLQRHPFFPQGINVSIAHVAGSPLLATITMRVWERGVGVTASCGTAACAVKVAAVSRQLLAGDKYHTLTLQNDPDIQLLMVRWDKSGHVFLHGPVTEEFKGELAL